MFFTNRQVFQSWDALILRIGPFRFFVRICEKITSEYQQGQRLGAVPRSLYRSASVSYLFCSDFRWAGQQKLGFERTLAAMCNHGCSADGAAVRTNQSNCCFWPIADLC
jgi:hypothetical protein